MFISIVLVILIVLLLGAFLYVLHTKQFSPTDQTTLLSPHQLKNSYLDESIFFEGVKTTAIVQPEIQKIVDELRKKIVGMDEFLVALITALFTGGHVLVEGVPGLAKTKTIATLSEILDMDFKRVQFTPDMLPADIIGVEVFNGKSKEFEIKLGPVFSNIVLADEINRATPKVQSALLEAMQEHQVTIGGTTYLLPEPFFVLATQNPIEQEGTYPLPEAQMDRFLFKILIDYPTQQQELAILETLEHESDINLKKILNPTKLAKIQQEIDAVMVSDDVRSYITRLVCATREPHEHLLYGASPRASISLFFGAKVLAYLQGQDMVTHNDVQKLALLVLRHRVGLSYDAKIDGVKEDQILAGILKNVPLE